jgi:hypothetical protein
MKYQVRPIKWAIGPENHPLFSERVTIVELDDEAGGEFVVIRQQTDQPGDQRIAIDTDEWPTLRRAIDHAVKQCRDSGAQP